MLAHNRGQVITFYSYKGGTGRTMALANIACLLADRCSEKRGVLIVDLDLEAPALHQYFRNKFEQQFADADDQQRAFDEHPGLIDLFLELDAETRAREQGDEGLSEDIASALFDEINLDRFIIPSDIPCLHLLKAGCFDTEYASRVNSFNWEQLYTRVPWLIRCFAGHLAETYQYVLIDSRTGFTDAGGICTMLMPEKLVVVFTPNRQSLTGVAELVREATSYRKQSDDLRPLVVFPLVSRVEATKTTLRKLWRCGDSEKGIAGYQPQFEEILEEIYALPRCDLEDYFNEVLIQHVPAFSYGEEIAVLDTDRDSLAMTRRYESFTHRLTELDGPWEYHAPPPREETSRELSLDRHLHDVCPYRGLAAFTEADAGFFFGREALVSELVDQLNRNPRLLALVGPSGSGKSSVIQAGLFPALRRGQVPGSEAWHLIAFRPDTDPFAALSTAGLDGAQADDLYAAVLILFGTHPDVTRLVLYSDQFERLFASCPESVQRKFLDQLAELLESNLPVTIILNLRADFYSHLLGHEKLVVGLRDGQVNLPRMDPDELRSAIEEPAQEVGLRFEVGLVDVIVRDAGETHNPLPLLQFALTQLWERREEGILTFAAYEEIGGVAGAIARWAEDVYSELGPDEQRLAQQIFTRLVHYGEGDVPNTRVQRSLSELIARPDKEVAVRQLVQQFADARLLVTGGRAEAEQPVELVGDVLIREWERLSRWVREQREFYLWRQRLDERSQEWKENGRDKGALLAGALLVEAEKWLADRGDELNPLEQLFIRQSAAQRRRTTLVRIAVASTIVVLILVALTVNTATQRQLAKQRENAARTAAKQQENAAGTANAYSEQLRDTIATSYKALATERAEAEAARSEAAEVQATAIAERNIAEARRAVAEESLGFLESTIEAQIAEETNQATKQTLEAQQAAVAATRRALVPTATHAPTATPTPMPSPVSLKPIIKLIPDPPNPFTHDNARERVFSFRWDGGCIDAEDIPANLTEMDIELRRGQGAGSDIWLGTTKMNAIKAGLYCENDVNKFKLQNLQDTRAISGLYPSPDGEDIIFLGSYPPEQSLYWHLKVCGEGGLCWYWEL